MGRYRVASRQQSSQG